MLKLERHLASGTERDVYLHPHFPDRVIKIRRKTAHADRNFVEYSFHRSARLQFQHIPKCYGWVDTDHGRGLEYELISEEDGSPSCRLTEVVSSGALSASVGSLLLDEFFSYALRCGLIVYDEGLGNFLYQRHTGKLFLVDGFGPRGWGLKDFVRSKYPVLARRKIRQCRDATMHLWQQWLLAGNG